MASFPGSIYSPTNPVSTNPRTSPSLAGEVSGLNDEVVAVETALGTNLSNIFDGVQWFAYAGNPNGNVTTSAKGSICVDTSTPAIYQAAATGNSSWIVQVITPGVAAEVVVATSGSTHTLSPVATAVGSDVTLSANCTFTMPTAQRGAYCYVRVHQASSGGPYTATFSSVLWPGGSAPTISTGASAIDLYEFQSDGTSWYGLTAGQAFS